MDKLLNRKRMKGGRREGESVSRGEGGGVAAAGLHQPPHFNRHHALHIDKQRQGRGVTGWVIGRSPWVRHV